MRYIFAVEDRYEDTFAVCNYLYIVKYDPILIIKFKSNEKMFGWVRVCDVWKVPCFVQLESCRTGYKFWTRGAVHYTRRYRGSARTSNKEIGFDCIGFPNSLNCPIITIFLLNRESDDQLHGWDLPSCSLNPDRLSFAWIRSRNCFIDLARKWRTKYCRVNCSTDSALISA